ncbi:MAG: P-II family nitrogen regulator [Halomonadaceae bacterium]|nr:MAG: P-II family nitrogen regulator [Halomonadaceae bacterium]
MGLKLIIVLTSEEKTNAILKAARGAGASGGTIINNARGQGSTSRKTFLGLTLEDRRDMVLFLVPASRARAVLDAVCEAGDFEHKSGTGIAFQLDVEDAVGLRHQLAQMQGD